MNATLRPYRATDFEAIADFWVAAWVATGIAEDFAARRSWLRAHLERLAAAGAEIIVVCDSRAAAVGFATIDKAGYLDQLCISPERQGEGLARLLIETVQRRASGPVTLHVNRENARARAIYERAGFAVSAEEISALSGRPTLRMVWRASEAHDFMNLADAAPIGYP